MRGPGDRLGRGGNGWAISEVGNRSTGYVVCSAAGVSHRPRGTA